MRRHVYIAKCATSTVQAGADMKTITKVGAILAVPLCVVLLITVEVHLEKLRDVVVGENHPGVRSRGIGIINLRSICTGCDEHGRAASLLAHPSRVANGGKVTASWTGVSSPSLQSPFDWVGVYCPPHADPHAYLDFGFVNESPTYEQGYGSIAFTLYNVRTDCAFRYYRNDTYTELVTVSNNVSFEGGGDAPLQGHLALTGQATEMRVSWTSLSSGKPVVFYGTAADNLTLSASGVSRTYTNSDMCGPPANQTMFFINPGFLHDVLLTELQPKSTYYYKFGSEGVFSDVKSFTTAIPSGDPTPFKFIMYGDMGLTGPPAAETTAKLVLAEIQNGAGFVVHQGDLSYAWGSAIKWDIWMNLIEPCASLAPYMVSIGNHEYDHETGANKDPSHANGEGFHPEWGNYGDDSYGECGVPPFYRFHMPDTGNSLWWYSYDYGLAHFTVFSTEHNFTAGSLLYQWLERDLKSVDRRNTPWLIVVGHRPMYSSEKYPSDYKVTLGIQNALEDLFYEWRVDLAVWGHYHAYERTCAVFKQKCNSEGTVHIVVGTAGYPLDDAGTYGFPWSLHYEPNYGYLRVSVANTTALHLEYIRNTDNIVADQTWLSNNIT